MKSIFVISWNPSERLGATYLDAKLRNAIGGNIDRFSGFILITGQFNMLVNTAERGQYRLESDSVLALYRCARRDE
jgi:ethanolamine utilization microcompartment shell protein EutS